MENSLRRVLIDVLLRVPVTNDFTGRTALLISIPNAGSLPRDHNTPRADLNLIVNNLYKQDSQLLGVFIEEASDYVGSEKLKKSLQDLQQQVETGTEIAVSPSYKVPQTCHFDLDKLVDECLPVLESRGLVGLVVPCDDGKFLENFCERLKEELLGRENTQVRPPLSFNPKRISVSRAVAKVKRYQALLQSGNVVCPVRVPKDGAAIANRFWQNLCFEFDSEFEYRLIIVMAGPSDCVFPDGPFRLPPPQFKEVHVLQWFQNLVRSLGKSEDIIDRWTTRIIENCRHGDTLHIRRIYEHLEDILLLVSPTHRN